MFTEEIELLSEYFPEVVTDLTMCYVEKDYVFEVKKDRISSKSYYYADSKIYDRTTDKVVCVFDKKTHVMYLTDNEIAIMQNYRITIFSWKVDRVKEGKIQLSDEYEDYNIYSGIVFNNKWVIFTINYYLCSYNRQTGKIRQYNRHTIIHPWKYSIYKNYLIGNGSYINLETKEHGCSTIIHVRGNQAYTKNKCIYMSDFHSLNNSLNKDFCNFIIGKCQSTTVSGLI